MAGWRRSWTCSTPRSSQRPAARPDLASPGARHRAGPGVVRLPRRAAGLADVGVAVPAGTQVAWSGPPGRADHPGQAAHPAGRPDRRGHPGRRDRPAPGRPGVLRSALVMVPQDGFLFDTSVAGNVRMGRPRASDGEVLGAFEALGLGGWVDGLPGVCAPGSASRASTCPVGERQLVALARGYLADPGCLILDEATSAVDPATEVALRRHPAAHRGPDRPHHRLAGHRRARRPDHRSWSGAGWSSRAPTTSSWPTRPAPTPACGSWVASLSTGSRARVRGKVEGCFPATSPSLPHPRPDPDPGRPAGGRGRRADRPGGRPVPGRPSTVPTDNSASPAASPRARRDLRPRFSPDGRWLATPARR